MKTIRATFDIVTPMFLGDADQKPSGFRLPSFKGALRFWWRALAWGGQAAGTVAALRDLHQREGALFGMTSGEGGRQSRVLLTAKADTKAPIESREVASSEGTAGGVNGVGYLKGQGMDRRSAIPAGSFEITAHILPGVSEADRESLERALFAFGLFGGLGSRARRGFGSCALRSIDGGTLGLVTPRQRSGYEATVRALLEPIAAATPPYSAFSASSRVDLSTSGATALSALGHGGARMATFRTEVKADARIAGQVASSEAVREAPRRASFGLPLPFFFKDSMTNVVFDAGAPRPAKRDRRASPLILHVHPFPDDPPERAFALVHTLLPAPLLPQQDGIAATARRKVDRQWRFLSSARFGAPALDVALLEDYLDSFNGDSGFQKVIGP